jgi:hypothetical protein
MSRQYQRQHSHKASCCTLHRTSNQTLRHWMQPCIRSCIAPHMHASDANLASPVRDGGELPVCMNHNTAHIAP